MKASRGERGDLFKFAAFFLIFTILLGLVLRWQMAGYPTAGVNALYVRRAHSHIGFYGALFPVTWLYLRDTNAWIPGRNLILFYGLIVALSAVGFLSSGYGLLSIVCSTLILGIWLQFAWMNYRRRFENGAPKCLALVAFSIVLAALQVFAVAILARTHHEMSLVIARSFLAVLLFGVFVPVALNKISCSGFFTLPWLAATMATAAYLTGLSDYKLLALGPIWLAVELLRMVVFPEGVHAQAQDQRLRWVWGAFAGALALTGLQIIPHSYNYGIAGLHFLILGPLFLTFAVTHLGLVQKRATRLVYEGALVTMIAAIVGNLQILAATTGTILILMICKMAVKC